MTEKWPSLDVASIAMSATVRLKCGCERTVSVDLPRRDLVGMLNNSQLELLAEFQISTAMSQAFADHCDHD